jgi:hypothetical protein
VPASSDGLGMSLRLVVAHLQDSGDGHTDLS